jgi:mannosyl-oligosaccharide alpha-1,2-mannosidase
LYDRNKFRERSMKFKSLLILPLLFCAFYCVHTGRASDYKARMANQVRDEFLHAWNGYKKYAWGHDQLKPLSRSFRDWHAAPLLMTPVDAMDTMYLMGLTEEADKTREFVATNLSFDNDIYVKNFEITIRILGGLISTYQISGDKRLLMMAEDLGNRLLPVFESPTGMPYMYVNLKTGKVRGAESNPAEIGTLLIEFGMLSKLTGKPAYYDKAKRALVEVYKRRSPIGLVGSTINVETGVWIEQTSHISGGIDSYYEYLLKCSRLFKDPECGTMWQNSINAVNKYLAHQTPNGLWYSYANMNTGERTATHFGALDAFFPAVLALSGDLSRAKELEKSAYKMWTTFGIEPEEIDYLKMNITYEGYALRPEVIESAYYLYYFTNDSRYLYMGATFLDSLIRYCKTDAGYAALSSVAKKEKKDDMESFFFAETLKYLYLLYAPKETVDLRTTVFNTEAHPMKWPDFRWRSGRPHYFSTHI